MGSNGTRFAVLAVALAAAVALFVVLSGEDEDEPSATTATTASAPAEGTRADGQERDKPKPKPEPEPEIPLIEVEGGKPVGGVQELEFEAGEQAVFDVRPDTDMTFHLHGYDIERSVGAGSTFRFDFTADIEGVFELEEHDLATPIAEITVSPS